MTSLPRLSHVAAMIGLLAAPLPLLAEVQVPQSQAEVSLSFAPVVKATAPAVVNIYVRQVVEERRSPFAGDPFFDQFFSDMGPARQRIASSLGSGVLVSSEGIVVSNAHVVGGASDIRVILSDRREFDAKVLLSDPQSDLAILKIESETPLPALELGDSEALEVGDLVLAIGNPFGVGQTVSSGIVSGLARSALQVGDGTGYFVQTDAPINPGNSGGALVDMKGRLIGINSAIVTASGGSNGIGFAIPSNLVAAVVKQAEAGQDRFSRPWAGVTGQVMDGSLADALGLETPQGVLLAALHPQSPFAAAGLREGDVVLSLDGAQINTPQEFMFRLSVKGSGESVAVRYLSEGKEKSTEATLGPAPDKPDRMALTFSAREGLEGLSLARINPALIAEWHLPMNASGVIVTAAEGPAARAGFQAGDILVALNGITVSTPAEARDLAREVGRRWQVDLERQGRILRLRFRL